jgi:hypothetical protein
VDFAIDEDIYLTAATVATIDYWLVFNDGEQSHQQID